MLGISLLLLSVNILLKFGTVPTVWCFFAFNFPSSIFPISIYFSHIIHVLLTPINVINLMNNIFIFFSVIYYIHNSLAKKCELELGHLGKITSCRGPGWFNELGSWIT